MSSEASQTGTGTNHSEKLEKYLADNEDTDTVSRGGNRIFAVTDRRVIDIRSGQTETGKPIENVQTTLFTDIAKVDVRMEETISEVDTIRRIIAGILAFIGVLLMIGSANVRGSLSGVLILVGILILIGALILWFTAEETFPGGISIRLRHATPDESVTDRYALPEDQENTAQAVVRQVGHSHEP